MDGGWTCDYDDGIMIPHVYCIALGLEFVVQDDLWMDMEIASAFLNLYLDSGGVGGDNYILFQLEPWTTSIRVKLNGGDMRFQATLIIEPHTRKIICNLSQSHNIPSLSKSIRKCYNGYCQPRQPNLKWTWYLGHWLAW